MAYVARRILGVDRVQSAVYDDAGELVQAEQWAAKIANGDEVYVVHAGSKELALIAAEAKVNPILE